MDAFGVKTSGKILPKTISDTERAAKVNWLVTERNIWVTALWSECTINSVWKDHTQFTDIKVVALTITERDRAGG